MKIWIAGPMSGRPDLNFHEFGRVTRGLRMDGHEVVNPAEFEWISGRDYSDILLNALTTIKNGGFDAIVTLEGYLESPGAKAEVAFGEAIGLRIFHAPGYLSSRIIPA